jgi:hypothetical protein
MGMQTIEERTASRGHRHERVDTHVDGQGSLQAGNELRDEVAWKVDESWTAIVGYIAELSVPGEG